MNLPHFPFYPGDWMSDQNVQAMTLEEVGAYITLLCLMWMKGKECALPDNDVLLARMLHVSTEKWSEFREVLIDGPMAVFSKDEGGNLTNNRLVKEYKKAVSKVSQAIEAGKKSGEIRKRSTDVQRTFNGRFKFVGTERQPIRSRTRSRSKRSKRRRRRREHGRCATTTEK